MQSIDLLMAGAVLLPVLASIGVLVLRGGAARRAIVIALAIILVAISALLVRQGPFTYSPPPLGPLHWEQLLVVGDVALILAFLYFGWRAKNSLIIGLTVLQALVVGYLEVQLAQAHPETDPVFFVDQLSLIMALVIGVVGSAIAVYAIQYMDEHEHHLHLATSRQPQFFAVTLGFLGAMNGLVFANSLPWLFFFWEVTTLCSFLLIGHDGTPEAKANAQRALWMNLTGGVGFAIGMVILQTQAQTLTVQKLIENAHPDSGVLLGLGLLVFAGCTKAAQMPFQSWLLGAMVAPTPVSALLHSSTMVKAGVYLIVRMAPGFDGTWLSQGVALAGAFTFVATAALAVGQSNAKRVLAYSTISNLGLIICCAGINTPLAISAAMLLILFHAVSKGLLFLAVGAIEHKIGSRDIEDMEGLLRRLPVITIVTLVGVLSMLLPPFGVLVAKWAAMEAAAQSPLVMILIAAGSAFTVVFWTKWMGHMVSSPPSNTTPKAEVLPSYYSVPLIGLASIAVVLTALVGWVMDSFIQPAVASEYATSKGLVSIGSGGQLASPIGSFPVWPLLLVLIVMLVLARFATGGRKTRVEPAYMCGENVAEFGTAEFRTAGDQAQAIKVGSYYFAGWLSEGKITPWANPVAIALLVALLGVAFL